MTLCQAPPRLSACIKVQPPRGSTRSRWLLPPGDYGVSFDELRQSILVKGAPDSGIHHGIRLGEEQLVGNLEILTRQLWQAGIREVFADGSFVEDKDHPNDIDGYFDMRSARADHWRIGAEAEPARSVEGVDLGAWLESRAGDIPRSSSMWHQYRVELYPHSGPKHRLRIPDKYGNARISFLFPSAAATAS